MLRLLLVILAIKTVCSIVSPPQNFNTTYNDAVEVFSGSVNLQTPKFERIQTGFNPPTKKYETVRKFLEHYNSLKPVAVLVDDSKESYEDARNFMDRVFSVTPNTKLIPFTLQIFNTTGVSPPISVKDEETFENLLNYGPENGMSSLDPTESNGTAVFFAILNAANALAQDNAILIFINRKISDEDLASHTGLLRKKNIKVYVIWGGLYPTKYSEDHLLRELCEYTGGLFLVNTEKDFSNYYYQQFLSDGSNSNINTSIILSKNNLIGESALTFPVDSKVTGIHVRISPFVSNGSISTPDGRKIKVLSKEDVSGYSTGSFSVTETGWHIVHLNISTAPTQGVGIWRLHLVNTLAPYNVTVFAYTKLIARAYFVDENASPYNSTGSDRKVVKLGISPFITSISSISLVDKNGQAVANNAKYTLVKDLPTGNQVPGDVKELDVEFNISEKPTYAVVQGKDSEGNEFSRLSYIGPYNSNEIFPQPTLTIEVAPGSELITTGGKLPVIIFEVTNHRSAAVDVRFTCKDEKSILRFLQPYRQIIGPQETVSVRLTLVTRFGSYEDEITFVAWIGSESFKKKVVVDVGTPAIYDTENPDLDYSFSSDCSKVVFSKCSEGTWTVQIRAKDAVSGLLQLTTYPKGIYFPNGFTTGTKEEVVGYYSDSCCSPDLQVTAVDRLNNRRVININAYQAFWGPAQIAALVLGILILILLIILIIYFIRRCIQNREDYNLPTYRGGNI